MIPFDELERSKRIFDFDMSLGSIDKIPSEHQDDFMNLNMVNVAADDVIYRIYSLDRFLELVQSKKNVLVNTKLWDDPFENFLLGCKAQLSTGEIVDMSLIRDSWYGQCWSFKEECDGLWRTNTSSKCKRAIKVKTTVGKLFRSFYDFSNPAHSLSFFIGKVEYVKKKNIISFLKAPSAQQAVHDTSNISQMRSLLFKREEFSYEKEVRLLYNCEANGSIRSCVYQYEINPNDLFDEIVIDPWAKDDDVIWIKKQLVQNGITRSVVKSDLYSLNNEVIILN